MSRMRRRGFYATFSTSFRTFNGSVPEHRLRQLLHALRIEANIYPMNEWASNDEFTMHGQILKHFTKQTDDSVDVLTEESINRSRMYMQRSVNVSLCVDLSLILYLSFQGEPDYPREKRSDGCQLPVFGCPARVHKR